MHRPWPIPPPAWSITCCPGCRPAGGPTAPAHPPRAVNAIDVTQCLACGGRMRILAALTEPGSIRTYLKGVGMPARPPPIAPARPPAARATSSAQLQTAAISPAPSNPAFRSTSRSCRQRLATRALILPKRTPPLALFKLKRRPRWVPTTPNGFSTYALEVGQEPHVIYHSEQLCLGTALSSDGELAAIGSTDRSGTSSRNLLVFKVDGGQQIGELWDGESTDIGIPLLPCRGFDPTAFWPDQRCRIWYADRLLLAKSGEIHVEFLRVRLC